MNEELCKLQKNIVKKYKLQKRIEIVHNKIQNVPDVVTSANVIIINNAFEMYISEDEQIDTWQLLKKNTKKGTIMVTNPPLEVTFKNLKIEIVLEDWVKPYKLNEDVDDSMNLDKFLYSDIALYQVL